MKLLLLVLLGCVVFVHSQQLGGFMFDNLFSNGCRSDADCSANGCCVTDDRGHKHCFHHRIKYLEHCNLQGETHSCGCEPGLVCTAVDHITSANVALEGAIRPGQGVCERTANYTTTPGPMVAVEGGR